MNYFCGNLHGNLDAYNAIKAKLRESDKLWILGDVIDSNEDDPSSGIQIIKDIQMRSNIELILGNHEFAHIMCYISDSNADNYNAWKNYLLDLNFPSEATMHFLECEYEPEDRDELFAYLIEKCEITRFIKIGDNYFYITHGFPSKFEGNTTIWQLNTCSSDISEKPFFNNILTDVAVAKNPDRNFLKETNTFTICSHSQIPMGHEGIYHSNGIFLVGADTGYEIPILGIDAAGYFFKNIIY